MEVAKGFVAEVGVFKGVDVGNMDLCSRYKWVEFVGGVRKGTEELYEIQGEEVMRS